MAAIAVQPTLMAAPCRHRHLQQPLCRCVGQGVQILCQQKMLVLPCFLLQLWSQLLDADRRRRAQRLVAAMELGLELTLQVYSVESSRWGNNYNRWCADARNCNCLMIAPDY